MSTKKYVNKLLSNWGVGWWQRQENYIALKVATVLPVKQRTGNYGSMDRADWFRDEVAERVRGQESAGGDYEVDLDNEYNCRRRSFHYDIPNDELEETDKPFDLKRDGTRFVMQKFAIRAERQFASSFLGSGKGWNDRTGVASTTPSTNQFTQFNKTGAKPVDVVHEYRDEIAGYGFKPNVFIASPDLHRCLCNHDDVLKRIQYSQKGIVTEDLLAELFEIEHYYVARAVANTAVKGAAENTGYIFRNGFWLGYIDPTPASVETPTACMTFALEKYFGATRLGSRIKEFPIDEKDCVRIEGDQAIDMHIVEGALGTYGISPLATA